MVSMPIKVLEVAGGLGVALVCSGDIAGADFINATRELLTWEKDRLAKLILAFVDQSSATTFAVQSSDLDILASLDLRLAELVSPGMLVAVTAPQDLQFGMSRMWQALAQRTSWEVIVVRDDEEAIGWLRDRSRLKFGVDVPPLDYST